MCDTFVFAISATLLPSSEDGESVEWVNMCWRKIWRVYQRGLERWLAGVLQPVFDNIVQEGSRPTFLQGLKIQELTFDHQAPYFSNLRRRTSRKDSDLNGVVDVRYTGGARMLLVLEVGGGRWRMKVPVLVSDLDLECQLWLKIRLAPLTPYLGTISFAFVGPPSIKVQLAPYNSVRLMRVPVLQNFLTRLLTKDLPAYMVLPKRLDINIPPAVTAVAEAAVGRDAVMRAVASAVLQADALEQSLLAALPLGPQSAAGGITLPKSFQGELSVSLIEGRDLPVWGFPWQSNPYCRLTLGKQAVISKRESETSLKGSHRRPIWNQEFEFLVENLQTQVLEVFIKDSHITGRPEVGKVEFPLDTLPKDGSLSIWLPIKQVSPGQSPTGELHLDISYKPFIDEDDSGYIEAEKYAKEVGELTTTMSEITDIKSAAAASSKAAAAASAAFSAVAMTRAAAARAAHKAQNAAIAAAKLATLSSDDETSILDYDDDETSMIDYDNDDKTSIVNDPDHKMSMIDHDRDDGTSTVDDRDDDPDSYDLDDDRRFESNGVVHAGSHDLESGHVLDLEILMRSPMDSPESHSISLDTIQAAAETLEYSQKASNGDQEADVVLSEPSRRLKWWLRATSWISTLRIKRRTSNSKQTNNDDGSSIESVVLPPDLPLEEIAKEVVRLKNEADKDVEERRSELLEEAMKRSDQKWFMLFCFLTALSIGMLTIVAVRIGT
eukprot:g7408.t1